MKKKVWIVVAGVLLVVIGGLLVAQLVKQHNSINGGEMKDKKSLVLFFSATGRTEVVAEKIKDLTGSDMMQIRPLAEYTNEDLNYGIEGSRATAEQNDPTARPNLADDFDLDLTDYGVIYIGYPIWWGTHPKIILTLLDNYDFSGKALVPFCTSGSADVSTSLAELREYKPELDWREGKRFEVYEETEVIEEWLKSL